VVVDDLDFICARVTPHEAKSPLIINPNTVLTFAVSPQGLKPIARRSRQIAQFGGAIQLPELTSRNMLDCTEPTAGLPPVQPLGLRAAERPDHKRILFCNAFNVKR